MAAKRSKASNDDFDELFEGIGDDNKGKKTSSKSKQAGPKPRRGDKKLEQELAELENELGGEEPARPHTPRVKETAASKVASKRSSTATPPPGAPRHSEDKPTNVARKSVDSTRSLHASFTPSATSSDLQDAEKKGTVEQTVPTAAGGGWWGGIFATASATANAAMKQAEAAYKEIQQNEEAKKWADQVRGNVGALKDLGRCTKQESFRVKWHICPRY